MKIEKMKHKLIGLLIFLAGFANAQIGIDLTEMIPAPDSGYIIITTGDEYPDRGLQKYVRASDILGIDTLFQNGDSLCILMRSEEEYRCFPVDPTIDTHLATVTHTGDSIILELNNGIRFATRDSFLTAGEVAKIARDSIVFPEFPVDTFVTDFFRDGDSLFLERNDGEGWKANIRPTIDQIFDPCGINLIENSHF